MPPSISLEECVVHEGTNHSFQNCFLSPFPRKEGGAIVKTLHFKMMVMSGSQPMTPMLHKVEPYPLLEDNYGRIEGKFLC